MLTDAQQDQGLVDWSNCPRAKALCDLLEEEGWIEADMGYWDMKLVVESNSELEYVSALRPIQYVIDRWEAELDADAR